MMLPQRAYSAPLHFVRITTIIPHTSFCPNRSPLSPRPSPRSESEIIISVGHPSSRSPSWGGGRPLALDFDRGHTALLKYAGFPLCLVKDRRKPRKAASAGTILGATSGWPVGRFPTRWWYSASTLAREPEGGSAIAPALPFRRARWFRWSRRTRMRPLRKETAAQLLVMLAHARCTLPLLGSGVLELSRGCGSLLTADLSVGFLVALLFR